ncbi:MAG TPA: NrfD/PsrC family molybdoenzyme membrane anchor subunit [Candidatus Eisenbacteria bacterium]|nr:NrfD/PsrC family molybdoenzyme membrane anchor subunit [Candidatus Eisenbacteria bacterium]
MSELPRVQPDGVPELDREQRLTLIQREAMQFVPSSASSFPVASTQHGYYDLPMVKEPSWSWEIPLYFFVGGAAGSAGLIGAVARLTGDRSDLVSHARKIAFAGAVVSPALLISDLGRPARFLAMLRVFKPQSPMSVGVWVLMAFSAGTTLSNAGEWVDDRTSYSRLAALMQNLGDVASLLFGLPLVTYTGVLIGATVIPAWNRNIALLPAHFAASGMAACVGLLELMGHENPALQALGVGSALIETGMGASIELNPDPAMEPLKHGPSGWLIRVGGVLSGPVPLVLRAFSFFAGRKQASRLRKYAAVSSVVGSAITRAAWIHAGHISARESRTA